MIVDVVTDIVTSKQSDSNAERNSTSCYTVHTAYTLDFAVQELEGSLAPFLLLPLPVLLNSRHPSPIRFSSPLLPVPHYLVYPPFSSDRIIPQYSLSWDALGVQ